MIQFTLYQSFYSASQVCSDTKNNMLRMNTVINSLMPCNDWTFELKTLISRLLQVQIQYWQTFLQHWSLKIQLHCPVPSDHKLCHYCQFGRIQEDQYYWIMSSQWPYMARDCKINKWRMALHKENKKTFRKSLTNSTIFLW